VQKNEVRRERHRAGTIIKMTRRNIVARC